MPPFWSPTKYTFPSPSDFQQSQQQAWHNATQLPPRNGPSGSSSSPNTLLSTGPDEATKAWKRTVGKPVPVIDNANDGKKGIPPSRWHWQSLWDKGGGVKDVEEDDDNDDGEDAAKPAVDYRRVWKEALLARGLREEAEAEVKTKPKADLSLSPETRGKKGEKAVEPIWGVAMHMDSPWKRVWDDGLQRNILHAPRTVDMASSIREQEEGGLVFLPAYTLSRSSARRPSPAPTSRERQGADASATPEVEVEDEEDENEDGLALHPTPSRPSSIASPIPLSRIVFTHRSSGLPAQQQDQVPGSLTARGNMNMNMMFMRCRATKVYATEEGMGGSWMVVKADDASACEEWQVVDDADVEVEDDDDDD